MTASVSDLKGKAGIIPSSAIDLKLVQIWVQGGCSWYSYFADSAGRELVPELLLNDEKFVVTDADSMQSFVRETKEDGTEEYIWISSPVDYNVRIYGHKENIVDAKTFQPFTLKSGEFKQLWLTVHVPEDTPEGIYRGTLKVSSSSGKNADVPLVVRVLPFELPDPKTNYDLSKEFYPCAYNGCNLERYIQENGGDAEKAEKRLQ